MKTYYKVILAILLICAITIPSMVQVSKAQASTIIDIIVSASTDDCQVNYSTTTSAWSLFLDPTSTGVGWSDVGTEKRGGGYRFQNVTITPDSAVIDTAYITFTSINDAAVTTVNSSFVGEDTDDAATFSDIANYASRRGTVVGGANDDNITTATVAWNDIGAWTTASTYNSPELKTIIQEITDRAGWVSGNDLVIFWDDHADASSHTSNARRAANSYDGSTITCATLHIEYTAGTPSATTSAATNITNTTATLNGTVTSVGDENPTVTMYWGDNDGGTTPGSWDNAVAPTSPAQPQAAAVFYYNVTTLTAGTTYYFTAKATNSYGTSWGTVQSFNTTGNVPTIITITASNVLTDSVTLQGSVVSLGGSTTVYCYFEYGETISYGNITTEQSKIIVGSFSQTVLSLLPNTSYHYKAICRYGTSLYSSGDDATFTTGSGAVPMPPTNFRITASNATEIDLAWIVGSNATGVIIRYSTSGYPSSVSDGTSLYTGTGTSVAHTAGIVENTSYYYSAWGYNGSVYSATKTTLKASASVGGLAAPDIIEIIDVKSYISYAKAGDSLITITYKLIYSSGDPIYNVSDYFTIALFDGTTIKAQTRPTMWGYKMASIYQTYSNNLIWGNPYTISLKGLPSKWGDTPPEATWTMSSGDWVGADKSALRAWVLDSIKNIGLDYVQKLLDDTTDGTKLSETSVMLGTSIGSGASIVTNAISGARKYLPELFTGASSDLEPYSGDTHPKSLENSSSIDGVWGSGVETKFDNFGTKAGGMKGQMLYNMLFIVLSFIACAVMFARTKNVWAGLITFAICIVCAMFLGATIAIFIVLAVTVLAFMFAMDFFVRGN